MIGRFPEKSGGTDEIPGVTTDGTDLEKSVFVAPVVKKRYGTKQFECYVCANAISR